MQNFFAGLAERRRKKKLTQEQLAKILGVTRTTVTLWELGINKPRIETLDKLSKFFNCSTDELLYGV